MLMLSAFLSWSSISVDYDDMKLPSPTQLPAIKTRGQNDILPIFVFCHFIDLHRTLVPTEDSHPLFCKQRSNSLQRRAVAKRTGLKERFIKKV
ncbi:hypothetical protein TNCV_857311 [Trichonephila clavipes]|nr:hypothetical protein TNCV_857311 [Trichonephila clavipes]